MFRFKKSIFLKLYRYYLEKLFWLWLIFIALVLVLSLTSRKLIWNFRAGEKENIWNETWKLSLFKLSVSFYMAIRLISDLVWEAMVKKEDASILSTASPINRQNMLVAKVASFFTYYWVSNFFVFNLPIVFLSATSSWSATLIFLLFDSLLLVLVGFLLFAAPLFYFYFPARNKKLKFLIFLLYFALIFAFLLTAWYMEILESPWIPILLSFPVGFGFLSLYWKDFRRHDYT